jgi:hypothetical protein
MGTSNRRTSAILVSSAAAAGLAAWLSACGGATLASGGDAGGSDSGRLDATSPDAGPDAPADHATRPMDAPVDAVTPPQDAQGDGATPLADAGGDDADAGDAGTDSPTVGCIWDLPDAMPDLARGPACSGPQQQAAFAAMDPAPITLPGKGARLDVGSADAGVLTLAQAESIDCQGQYLGDLFGDCTVAFGFGNSQEVIADVDPDTGQVQFLTLTAPYTGTLAFQSRDKTASYVLQIGTQAQKNGAPFTLDQGWTGAGFDAEVDELYRGIVSTYAPAISMDPPGTTCRATQRCVVGFFGNVGFVFIPSLGFAWYVSDVTAAEPGPSIPWRLDLYP